MVLSNYFYIESTLKKVVLRPQPVVKISPAISNEEIWSYVNGLEPSLNKETGIASINGIEETVTAFMSDHSIKPADRQQPPAIKYPSSTDKHDGFAIMPLLCGAGINVIDPRDFIKKNRFHIKSLTNRLLSITNAFIFQTYSDVIFL
jgi:hypothetical protein